MKLEDLNESEEKDESTESAEGEETDGLDPAFVSSEKKPASRSALVFLAILVAAGGGMYFMYTKNGPASASAAATPEAAAASATINEFLSGGAKMKLMKQTLQDTEKVVQEFRGYPAKTQVPLGDLKTNPFRLLPPASDTPVVADNDAAARRKREEERVEALQAVQTLQLQSVLSGSKRACMINNTLYTEGQEAEGFIVEQIAANTVVVRKGVYRFELRMTR
jgi:hypothetical protein